MYNCRHVCNAKDAGYVEYPGLPGKMKTGCMRTPEYKSRYCSEHKIRACNFSLLATQEHEDDKEGTYVTAPNRMKYYLSSNEGSIYLR